MFVPEDEPVRLGQPVKGVKVWAADKDGKEILTKRDLAEGLWVLPKK